MLANILLTPYLRYCCPYLLGKYFLVYQSVVDIAAATKDGAAVLKLTINWLLSLSLSLASQQHIMVNVLEGI